MTFVGSSLAGKYMKILIISWKKKTKKEQRKKNTWVPNNIRCRCCLVLIWLLWVLIGFHRPVLGSCWLLQACVDGHRSLLACVGLHGLLWVLVGLLWPSLACSGCCGFWLACVGCYTFSLAFVGLHWPVLVFMGPSGLCWLSWAFVDLCWPGSEFPLL